MTIQIGKPAPDLRGRRMDTGRSWATEGSSFPTSWEMGGSLLLSARLHIHLPNRNRRLW